MNRYRVEVVANQSVEDDIIELLEDAVPELEYTLVPTVHGRGRKSKKLGNTTWPEQNFLLFTYVEQEMAIKIRDSIKQVQIRFPKEGISFFCVKEAEL